ncbi:MAG: DNA repair protein RadC [Pseudomonadota bacterium]
MNSDDEVVAHAMGILLKRLRQPGASMSSPDTVKNYLTLKLATAEREVFGTLWLDVQNRIVAEDDLFFGSVTHTNVHPREVIKTALRHNAAAVILYHNHPNGQPDPSTADKALTTMLCSTLGTVEVRMLDHLIVAGTQTFSFAEHGML